MQRKYTKPANSKKSRPKTAGEVIIENLKKDGDVIGIVVGGEKWPIEKLCRHEDCPYCENCPMHLFFDLEDRPSGVSIFDTTLSHGSNGDRLFLLTKSFTIQK